MYCSILIFYIFFIGNGYDTITIAFEQNVLATLKRDDALTGHSLQFGALYLFNASYEVA